MIYEERLIKTLLTTHVSEKTSVVTDKNNTFLFKVNKHATKSDVKVAVHKLFKVQVDSVRMVIVKGKPKRHGRNIGYRSSWKKAYVSLLKGQKLNFTDNII